MKKERRQEVQPYPQQSIDLMFWQYIEGVNYTVMRSGHFTNEVDFINDVIAEKLAHIKKTFHKRPSFDLKAEWVGDKIEIKKIMV